MVDINYIRNNIKEARRRLASRGASFTLDGFEEIDEQRRSLAIIHQQNQINQNTLTNKIEQDSKNKIPIDPNLRLEVKILSTIVKRQKASLDFYEQYLTRMLSFVPNFPQRSEWDLFLDKYEEETREYNEWISELKLDFNLINTQIERLLNG